jgi:putative peptide zinc metalloprotease protein
MSAAPQVDRGEMPHRDQTKAESIAAPRRAWRLRRDLQVIYPPDPQRQELTIFDGISGQYCRVSSVQWQRLQEGPGAEGETPRDPHLWATAQRAGLLRDAGPRRTPARRRGNLWMWRLPGLPVDPLARWLAARTDWLFAPVAVVLWGLVIFLAGLAVLIQWDRFHANLPGLQRLVHSGNLPLLFGTLWVTKAVHELGHATVCRRMGARCGEIGILLMCGTPCPYCDVTDSWCLPSAWRRSAIMLAGVYLELILAAVASLVWWFTVPGMVHYVALNVMVVCSVSTLMFNLNPLMRYDGYYVLADLCGSPNLRAEATQAFRQCCSRPLAGWIGSGDGQGGRGWGFAVYHVASAAYRVLVTTVIAVWLWHLADAVALRPLGTVAATGMLLAVPAASLQRWLQMVWGEAGWKRVPRLRRWTLAGFAIAAAAAIFLYPFPRHQQAQGRVDAVNVTPLYVPGHGRVAEVAVGFGEPVERGQIVVVLENPDLQQRLLALRGKHQAMQLEIQQLRRRAIERTELLEQLDTQRAAADAIEEQAARLEERLNRMTIRAKQDGILLPVLSAAAGRGGQAVARGPAGEPAGRVTAVSAMSSGASAPSTTTLDYQLRQKKGAWVGKDMAWGRIADPASREVILEIDSVLRASVQVGDAVPLRCAQSPAFVVATTIASEATVHRRGANPAVSSNRFRVACALPEPAARRWQVGSQVTAQLELPPESLARRLLRWWRETMRVG